MWPIIQQTNLVCKDVSKMSFGLSRIAVGFCEHQKVRKMVNRRLWIVHFFLIIFTLLFILWHIHFKYVKEPIRCDYLVHTLIDHVYVFLWDKRNQVRVDRGQALPCVCVNSPYIGKSFSSVLQMVAPFFYKRPRRLKQTDPSICKTLLVRNKRVNSSQTGCYKGSSMMEC